MALRLDREQQQVLRTILNVGRRKHANRTQLLAAISTGLVEANLRNPAGGDGTSSGWRQETSSSYPNVNRRDVAGAAGRFFDETSQALRQRPMRPGELSQSVQRSAFPGRYAQHTKEAAGLLAAYGLGKGSQRPSGAPSGAAGATTTQTTTENVFDRAGYEDAKRKAVLGSLLGKNPNNLLVKLGIVGGSLPNASDFLSQVVKQRTVQGAPSSGGGGGGGGFGGYHFVVGNKHQFSEERTDRGQDFSTNPGGAVNAIGRAKVVATHGVFPGQGPVLQLLDGPYKGKFVFYGHMRRSLVRAGQIVKAGQPVAVAGGVGGGGPGHAEVGFALDASGRIDPNVGSDHYSRRTGQPFHDLLYRAAPGRVRRRAIRSG